MVWLTFLASATIIALASLQLARHGDVIAIRSGLGGLFMGTLLIAAVTTLPEILVLVNAISAGMPDLAIGGLLGSNMFNMLVLAILDMLHQKQRFLRKAAMRHALTGSLAVLMITLVIVYIYADFTAVLRVGPLAVGADSLVLIAVYVLGLRQIEKQARSLMPLGAAEPSEEGLPSLKTSLLWFAGAALVLVFVTPRLVAASGEIAEITGLGTTFIGATLLAVVTSIPELATSISAVRIGADDMAIGNLFGSNMFGMALLGLTDIFMLRQHLFTSISDSYLLVAMIGLLMTIVGLISNLANLERRLFFIEMDALLLIILYFGGLFLLYSRGIVF